MDVNPDLEGINSFGKGIFLTSWVFAVVTWGIGDTLTTWYIFSTPEFSEANPFVRSIGFRNFIILKTFVLMLLPVFYTLTRNYHSAAWVAPVIGCTIFGLLGSYATIHNLLLFYEQTINYGVFSIFQNSV